MEDPIEMIEPAQPDPGAAATGPGFAQGCVPLMRQDPDIIMVGEIRDLETAEMAVQAALDRHLVFPPAYQRRAPAITRLMSWACPPPD